MISMTAAWLLSAVALAALVQSTRVWLDARGADTLRSTGQQSGWGLGGLSALIALLVVAGFPESTVLAVAMVAAYVALGVLTLLGFRASGRILRTLQSTA